MLNKTLDEMAVTISRTLQMVYGFAGLANGEDFAMINSTDKDGNDIKITIKVEKETE